jgi:hypothetical protein
VEEQEDFQLFDRTDALAQQRLDGRRYLSR